MIRKIGACLMAFVVAVSFSPVTAGAATDKATKQKIKKYFTQLKKLPNGASPRGKVDSLTKKLVKLDPKKTTKYYKTAVKKYPIEIAKTAATKLNQDVIKIATKSGQLTDKQLSKIETQVDQANDKVPTPTPPGPYQAAVSSEIIYA